ncbi:hypothetical protein ACHAWO_004951 [Cyclotella atomus]|uniref:Uncharacterized protein n=1 Tax=Cyclotella atomus TaxID=382360 RepID=A0ABD3NBJ6_9STRA
MDLMAIAVDHMSLLPNVHVPLHFNPCKEITVFCLVRLPISYRLSKDESSTGHYLQIFPLPRANKVSAEDRKALCQWGFDTFNHDVAMIAIGYFDRFLSKRGLPVVEACLDNQREFQLLSL